MRRPGLPPGRRRLAAAIVVACGMGSVLPPAASAHELLSWWSRDLLPISLEPGEWVEVESREASQGESYSDTLRCEVLQADGSLRWVRLVAGHGVEEWFVQIDLNRLESAESVLELVTRLYRREGKSLLPESVEELNSSAVARGRLRDPFQSPQIRREALPDSIVFGQPVRREQVVLRETNERRIPLGKQSMLYRQTLHSRATLSADVPIFGLLASETYHEEQTERFDANGRAIAAPPAIRDVRSWLRCLRFGRELSVRLPQGLDLSTGG